MALLKKINTNSEYSFSYIQKKSYFCDPKRKYTEVEYANGKIKRKYSDYENVIITLSLANLTTENIDDIIDNLVDGTYEYDYKGAMYRANFLVDKKPLGINESSSKFRYQNLKLNLKKSSDYVEGQII